MYKDVISRKLHWLILYVEGADEGKKVKEGMIVPLKSKSATEEFDYDEFVQALPKDKCRFGIVDLDFECEGPRNKVVLVHWSPDESSITQKMIYASSKGELQTRIEKGLFISVQANDLSEVAKDELVKSCKSKMTAT